MSTPVLPRTSDLVGYRRVDGAHRVALRAGLSVAVPLAVVLWLGHAEWSGYACFGAFASLYGRASEHTTRVQMQLSAAVTMTAAVLTGVVVGSLEHSPWVQVMVAALIASSGEVFARAHRYHPGGPLFFIFAFGAISSAPHHLADLPTALAVCGASALFSVLVGGVGIVQDPRGVRGALRAARPLGLVFRRSWKPAWIAVAVLLAGTAAVLLRIGHPYWAMVSAVAPMSAPHVTQQVAKGIQRVVGTTIGLLPSWLLLGLHLDPALAVLAIALLQFGTEVLVGSNYALAMLCITPLALLNGQLAHPRPITQLLFDRGVETAIGAVVGIALVLVGHVLRERRKAKVDDALDELRREVAAREVAASELPPQS